MSVVREKNVAKMQTTYVKQQESAEIAQARKRKLLYRRMGLFLAFAVFISYLMISSILAQASTLNAERVQKKQLDQQLAELKKQRSQLKQTIVNLNDNDYIAKLARKDYFFSNKNEIIFNIPDNQKGK